MISKQEVSRMSSELSQWICRRLLFGCALSVGLLSQSVYSCIKSRLRHVINDGVVFEKLCES